MAILFAVIGFSSYSIGDTVYKWLSSSYTVYSNIFFATLFSFIFLLIVAPFFGGLRSCLETKKLKLHLFRSCLFIPQTSLAFYAFGYLPMTNVYAVFFLTPLLSSILAVFLLKERPELYKFIAILAGFFSIMIILRPDAVPISVPVMAVFGSACFIALINVLARKIGEEGESFLSFALYPFIVILPVMFFLMLPEFVMPTVFDLVLLAMAGLTGIVGIITIPKGFTMAPLALVAPFHYVQILWGIVIGYFVFGDTLDWQTGIGAVGVILSGLFLIFMDQRKAEEQEKRPQDISSKIEKEAN